MSTSRSVSRRRGSADAQHESEPDSDLTVLAMPDYRDVNPYQLHLEEALEDRGVTITTDGRGGRWFPVLQNLRAHGVPDVLHVHFFHQLMVASIFSGPWPPVTSVLLSTRLVVELLVTKLLGTTLVWTAHDLMNHERRAMRTELVFKHLIIRFLCDDVVVHCEGAKDVVTDTYRLPDETREKMTVVPHGHFIDDYPNDVSRADARRQFGYGEDETVFLFFGWIRRYKNVPLLIETFQQLDDPDARLLVAGNPRTDDLEAAVTDRATTDDRVQTVLEFVPDEAIQRYMAAADVVVLPFRTDKQSLLTSGSALLAMSFGKPLIAPQIGCLGEAFDERGGIPYESTEPQALEAAMRDALDADLATMGRHNFRVAKRRDWESIAECTHRIYAGQGCDWEER